MHISLPKISLTHCLFYIQGIIKSCSDFELLFELVQICQHYLVKSLESIVQAHIRELGE